MSAWITSERDIWLAARAMTRRYGSNAAREAEERATDARERGDPEGSTSWQRIMTAIERLQAEKPGPGDTVQ
jgi:hypothetical protein